MKDAVLEILNDYSGLISLLGLVFSIWVWITAENIKKSMRKNQEYKVFRESKKNSLKNLQSLIDNIKEDNVTDNATLRDVLLEINNLSKQKGFVDFISRMNIWIINFKLRKGITSKNIISVVWHLGILLGRLNTDPVSKYSMEDTYGK